MASSAGGSPGSLTYQGRIKNSLGEALETSGVRFEFTIMNPAGTCALYREISNSIDMRNSAGVFDIPIGTGTKNFPTDPGFKLLDSFSNGNVLNCEGGGTYTPVANDKRLLRVQFHDGSGWRLITPDNEIRSVPYAGHSQTAQVAQKLGTNSASDFLLKSALPLCGAGTFLRHIAPAGTFECSAPLVDGTNVVGNISGSAAGFTGMLSGDVSGPQSATSVDRIKGVPLDMTGVDAGKVLKYDGSKWAPADDNAGAVTTLSGDVTATGSPVATVTLNDAVVTSVKIADGTIVDADISTSAEIADSKLATISTAGKVSGNAVTSGTIGGSTAINTSGLIQTSNALRLYSGANHVELKAPPTLSSDLSFRLPDSAGSAGQVLVTNGAGTLSWAGISSSSIPNLSGDVTSTSGTNGTVVEKIRGVSVAPAAPLAGQVLVHDSSQWNPQYFGFGQLRSTVTGALQMPSSCGTSNKTLNWSAITDTFVCTNIAISSSQVSGLGTAAAKDFGTSAGNLVELDGTGKIPAALIPSSGTAILIGGNSTGSTLTMGTNDAQALALKANNAVAMTINTSGQVGIGNSFPSNRLDVGSGTDTSNTISVRGSQTTALDLLNTSFGGLWIGVNFSGASVNGIPNNSMGMSVGNSPIVFASGTPTRSERMRISNVGNVGIGVSFPTMKLEVGGTIRTIASSPNIEVKDSDSTNTQNARNGFIYFTDSTGAQSGYIGDGLGTTNALMMVTTRAEPLLFTSNNIDSMIIDTTGKVGIGTMTPTETLHINGSIKVEGCPADMEKHGGWCMETSDNAAATRAVALNTCSAKGRSLCPADVLFACDANNGTACAWTDVSGAHQWAAGYCPQPTSASWHENFMVINGDNLTVCANSAATYGYRCCKPLP